MSPSQEIIIFILIFETKSRGKMWFFRRWFWTKWHVIYKYITEWISTIYFSNSRLSDKYSSIHIYLITVYIIGGCIQLCNITTLNIYHCLLLSNHKHIHVNVDVVNNTNSFSMVTLVSFTFGAEHTVLLFYTYCCCVGIFFSVGGTWDNSVHDHV